MGKVLHGSATIAETIRRAILISQESVQAIASLQSKGGFNPDEVEFRL
jgi:hypothetical protein